MSSLSLEDRLEGTRERTSPSNDLREPGAVRRGGPFRPASNKAVKRRIGLHLTPWRPRRRKTDASCA